MPQGLHPSRSKTPRRDVCHTLQYISELINFIPEHTNIALATISRLLYL